MNDVLCRSFPTLMKCPKCAYVRSATDTLLPEWQCPKCGIVYAKYRAATGLTVSLTLSSGQTIEFGEIKLYDSNKLRQLSQLYAAVDKNYRGFSTGIGFIGDFEDVAAASVVKGVVEGAVSVAMASTAAKQVEEAEKLYRQIRSNGVLVPVTIVENIDLPQPELWRVPHFKSPAKLELASMPGRFVTIHKDGRDKAIFWDKLEDYSIASI
jgi:hypothetical protein